MLILQVLEDEPRPRRGSSTTRKSAATWRRSVRRRWAVADVLLRRMRASWPKTCGATWPCRSARPIGMFERLRHWCRRNPVAASLLFAALLGSAFDRGTSASRGSSWNRRPSRSRGSAGRNARRHQQPFFIHPRSSSRVQSHGILVVHDYASRNGAIPLPVASPSSPASVWVNGADRHAVPARQDDLVHAQGRRPSRRSPE